MLFERIGIDDIVHFPAVDQQLRHHQQLDIADKLFFRLQRQLFDNHGAFVHARHEITQIGVCQCADFFESTEGEVPFGKHPLHVRFTEVQVCCDISVSNFSFA